ncbi:MarR family transcriptional regulator [Rhodococcus jostii]|uniref:MarR family transcriptional regulator n=1 Tax=Rhodococcus jostii TaxID=132919 RepID=UPI003649A966
MNARLDGDIGFLLSRASGRILRGTNAALAPTGLRARAYAVLRLICEQPAGLTQRVIARFLDLHPSQVVALVSELERTGLVERTVHPLDRRINLVCSTSKGRRVNTKAAALTECFYADTLGHLPARHTTSLRRTLTTIVLDAQRSDGTHELPAASGTALDESGVTVSDARSPAAVVERAVGAVMLAYGIPAVPAFDLLTRRAQDVDATVVAVAEQVVGTITLPATALAALRQTFDPLQTSADHATPGKDNQR